MSDNQYVRIEMTTSKDNLDQIGHIAQEFSCLGIEFFNIDESKVDEILGDRAFSGGDISLEVLNEVEDKLFTNDVKLKIYFSHSIVPQIKVIEEVLSANDIPYSDFIVSIKETEDWNKLWRSFYRPIYISDELSVVPSWLKNENSHKDIYIYPGMGFGTGTHETTELCLRFFDRLCQEKVSLGEILDFGCGSGILGIGAIKKSQSRVDFVDIDPAALDNCLYNINLNWDDQFTQGSQLLLRSRFVVSREYDLVFANILEPVIIHEADSLRKAVKKSGYLVLSGLLIEQGDTIKNHFQDQFDHIETIKKNDWCAILLRKK